MAAATDGGEADNSNESAGPGRAARVGGGADTGWKAAGLALAWLAGVALHLRQPALWPTPAYAALLALGAVGLGLGWRWGRRWRGGFAAGLVGAALLGGGVSGWHAALRLNDSLAPALEGRDLVVEGSVASLPQRGTSGLRFEFAAERALDAAGQPVDVPRRLAIGWYAGFHDDATLSQPQRELRAGQRWRFTLRLRRPHGNSNPHGFDYELHLFEQGVRATGYVRDAPAVLLDAAAAHPVERLRQRVRDAIDAGVADRRAAGVLAALAVGDQGAIERDDWDLFRNAGVAHLMSISGLHVTMFAWLAGGIVTVLWRRSVRAMLWLPAPHAARWGGLTAALGYAVFSGWGVPAQRTVWMLAAVTLLQTLGLRWPWTLVLLAAAVVVTLVDPWALCQAGFWLSFAAVGLLLAAAPAHQTVAPRPPGGATAAPGRWPRWGSHLAALLRQGLRTQVVATLGLTPLTLIFFQQVSLIGFVANLVAIPLITVLVTPLALLGVVAAPLWTAAAWLLSMFSSLLERLTSLPGVIWTVAAAPLWAQAAGLVGAALMLLPLPWRLRFIALPLLAPLLLPPRALPPHGGFDLLAADVGQGSSVLVRTRGHLLVFDAGPQYSSQSDAGQRLLLPLLRARGDSRIDTLVLSHRDLDHVGGARALLAGLPVGELLSSLEANHPLRALSTRHTRCQAGQAWQWDGVRFEVLRPAPDDYARGGKMMKSNALSCVLRIAGARRSVLLTGDIEAEQEAALLRGLPSSSQPASGLASDVLIAPHHGSKTSSSAAFLAAVNPASAVFQTGYRNRFGHPAPLVLERYRALGIRSVASPECGAWSWSSDAGPPDGVCERDADRRYWHHRTVP